jgi:hypothetical protein
MPDANWASHQTRNPESSLGTLSSELKREAVCVAPPPLAAPPCARRPRSPRAGRGRGMVIFISEIV